MPFDEYNIAASSVAALVARVCTHPLDTVKTRLQVSLGSRESVVGAAQTILRKESSTAFYRGLPVALAFSVPGLSVYLTTYDYVKAKLSEVGGLGKDNAANHMISGLCAEVLSGLFWTPMEVMKNRLQVAERLKLVGRKYSPGVASELSGSDTARLARQIYSRDGLRGFYQGYWITLGVFVPYTVIYFVTYEKFKSWISSYKVHKGSVTDDVLPPWAYILSSAGACSIAAATSNTLDIVKTRWQVANRQGELKSSWEIMKHMWLKEGGLRAFTRGMLARVLWATPNTVISMTVFELLKRR
ncbi:mitochondrial carrier [Basidiobolus meristosporus CBS 931.73]|uniref:Mitochondrial carrier n=1 Tax=Basidiobolus meristosporus CBS 931.73 TaxID=1314790 RepID=A0A1Y1YMY9_9FUNG|nr:mitochondrial carrier [Basidiobolus meristosporus CBS 931.73]|eukprot:ORX99379.1 mitochondrial carrier [Basidiobolus meristosporus CBS 931.73]